MTWLHPNIPRSKCEVSVGVLHTLCFLNEVKENSASPSGDGTSVLGQRERIDANLTPKDASLFQGKSILDASALELSLLEQWFSTFQ